MTLGISLESEDGWKSCGHTLIPISIFISVCLNTHSSSALHLSPSSYTAFTPLTG